MAEAYSGYVTEWHGGRTRAYVNAYVESETDKTATIYITGCAQGTNLTQYGVATSCTGGGSNNGVILSASGTSNVAWCSGRITVTKTSGYYQSCSCTIWGEEVNGYGPISGSATATVSVWVGAKVLRPPSAPSNLTGARNAAASIELNWINNATNASSTLIERMAKGGSWTSILDTGKVLISYTDSPGVGSWKYRVRYWNTDGYSGFSNETDYIVTLCAPAAPTLLSPASGATIDANAGTALLRWQHNAIDSSPQSAAQVRYSADNISWQTKTTNTDQELSIAITGNTQVYWQVRTKGAHEDYSPWSGVSSFLVRTAPSIILHVQNPVTTVPVTVTWDYEDAYGTQVSYTMSIRQVESSSNIVYLSGTTENKVTIQAADFTPPNGEVFVVEVVVASSTGLQGSATETFQVAYAHPSIPAVALRVDPDTASVMATVFSGSHIEDTPETQTLSVFRGNVQVGANLRSGQSILDRTPPLDTPVAYRVVAYAGSGSVAECTETIVVHSNGHVVFNFAEDVARCSINYEESDATEGERELYNIASSRYPKVYYGEHASRSGSISADVFWDHDWFNRGEQTMLSAFERLKEYNGTVHMRLPYRDSLDIDCNVSITRSSDQYNIASVTVDWQAVGG